MIRINYKCSNLCKNCRYLDSEMKKIIERPTSNSLRRLDRLEYTCEKGKFKNSEYTLHKRICSNKERV